MSGRTPRVSSEMAYKTPPVSSNPTFEYKTPEQQKKLQIDTQVGQNDHNGASSLLQTGSPSEVVNLPTPLNPVRGQSDSPQDKFRDGDSFPPLVIQKTRSSGSNPKSPVLTRFTSEYAPNSSERRLHSFQINPVSRLASRPIEAPLLEEQQKALAHQPDSIREEKEAEDGSLIFTTYDTHSGPPVQQVWHCSEQIGQGSFSKVYLDAGKHVAVKVTEINEDDEDTRLRVQASLLRELELLQELRHPNIVQLIGSDSDIEHGEVKMALEYCEGGDLFTFLTNNRPAMSAEQLRFVFSNIVSALRYLHHNEVAHRDIKLENVLLRQKADTLLSTDPPDLTNVAVLSDFGLAKKINPDHPMMSTRCGSEDYVSPELLLSLEYDGKQNDCWSLGVLLYAMIESRLPFDPPPNLTGRRARHSKASHRIATITWSWYQFKDTAIDAQGNDFSGPKEIVNHLLVKRTKRWTIDQVAEHPWCQQCCT